MSAILSDFLREKKTQREAVLFGLVFLVVYIVIDSLNMSYAEMAKQYGTFLVLVNIALNLLMAGLSAYLMILSSLMLKMKGIEGKGSNFGFLSVIFGLLTYGCTPCVIALFANIGITFSVIALPFAGLPYKLISLLLIVVGIWISMCDIKRGTCPVKFKNT